MQKLNTITNFSKENLQVKCYICHEYYNHICIPILWATVLDTEIANCFESSNIYMIILILRT